MDNVKQQDKFHDFHLWLEDWFPVWVHILLLPGYIYREEWMTAWFIITTAYFAIFYCKWYINLITNK